LSDCSEKIKKSAPAVNALKTKEFADLETLQSFAPPRHFQAWDRAESFDRGAAGDGVWPIVDQPTQPTPSLGRRALDRASDAIVW
jgi:hypothetical protein